MQIRDLFNPILKPNNVASTMPVEDALLSQITYGFNEDDEGVGKYDIAIIGVADGRNSIDNEGCAEACDVIRPFLASLRKTSRNLNIVDLGNVKGKTLNDRYFAVAEVTKILLSHQVRVLLLGGGQDYNLPVVKSLVEANRDIAVSVIDSKLDLVIDIAEFSSQTFLSQIREKYHNNVFELNVLGIQKYLVGESQEQLMNESYWEVVRLKDLRDKNISRIEPYLRDADLVSFDVGAIQQNYMPYYSMININGFNGFEACQTAWYAGMSDSLKCFSLQEYNPLLDKTKEGGALCAQILWHLLEGISVKVSDIPSEDSNSYKISVVHLHEFDVDIRFYTNRVNKRWWIEVPFEEKVRMLACDEKDYLLAQHGELPEKWWRFFQRRAVD
ncbi:hypothetical protein E9993_21495 [Labilibacter sediminis]|nr:hypothetical protein E9993_21495 [Labilibacter sediminis]